MAENMKQWDNKEVNPTKFVDRPPLDKDELYEKLLKIKKEWSHVLKIGIIKKHNAIFIDLDAIANTGVPFVADPTPDSKIPLRAKKADQADKLVRNLIQTKILAKKPKPLSKADAQALWELVIPEHEWKKSHPSYVPPERD